MPTVLRVGGMRFFFYSLENEEPAHIHIEYGEKTAKVWLDPVSIATNHGFRAHETGKLLRTVTEHRERFREAWNEHFNQTQFVRRRRTRRR